MLILRLFFFSFPSTRSSLVLRLRRVIGEERKNNRFARNDRNKYGTDLSRCIVCSSRNCDLKKLCKKNCTKRFIYFFLLFSIKSKLSQASGAMHINVRFMQLGKIHRSHVISRSIRNPVHRTIERKPRGRAGRAEKLFHRIQVDRDEYQAHPNKIIIYIYLFPNRGLISSVTYLSIFIEDN